MLGAGHFRLRAVVLTAATSLIAGVAAAWSPPSAVAVSADVVISQVYGGGGNSNAVYTNDFVELYNRGTTTVSLSGWSVQYASASGTGNFGSSTTQLTPLAGSLAAGQYLLIQEAAGTTTTPGPLPAPDVVDPTPINMSGTGGKVALVTSTSGLGCNGGSAPCSAAQLALIKDLVGWGSANFYETAPALATDNGTAAIRKGRGAIDTDNNAADFIVGTPDPRNSTWPMAGVGSATPSILYAGDATLLTVAATPASDPVSTGMQVACNLSQIGGPAVQAFFDDGTNGDVTATDDTFSFATSVASATSVGAKTLPCTVRDDQLRSVNATISLDVTAVVPIGTVNGPVLDTDNAATRTSPYTGQKVAVQGVIYEKTLQAISNSANTYKGFFLQNTSATEDADPQTSNGLFVFLNTNSTMPVATGGTYTPQVGDEIIVFGTVTEYYNMTELTSPTLVKAVVRSGVDIDAEAAPVVAAPPTALADANRYWERLQGMRVAVPQNSVVLGGRNVFSPADAEIWVARPDSTVAERSDVYARRAFRDAHPLDDNYNATAWDGNGYRILMGSLGIKAAAADAQALIDPARTFDTVTNSPAGGLNYTFSKYRIEISDQPTFAEGPDPAQNSAPQAFDRSGRFSIVDYNLENLYDYRNNPASGCDFAGDTGCPKSGPFQSAVNPPYDYVPASDAAYQARLTDIAHQITSDLHSPDVLMVQEVENQDICTVAGGALTCGTTDNADGRPDVLQELALRVASLGGPAYDAAFDRDSSDLRGIAPAFLYRTDRVELPSPVGDPVLGQNPAVAGYTALPYDADVSNPKTLNAVLPTGVTPCETSWVFPRAPGVALFRIWTTSVGVGTSMDVYAINNHFKSGPDTCVGHRTEQAEYNAALVSYIEQADPAARIVLGGDLNVYPRPDDPFAPIGQSASSDQLGALYDPSLELTNLWDVLVAEAPEAAYSYVYLGQAQTLDQMFVNEPMLGSLAQFRVAHINSDFPADYPDDVARGTSDHDPNIAVFRNFPWTGPFAPLKAAPALNPVKAGSAVPVKFALGGDQGLGILAEGYPRTQEVSCTTLAPVTGTSEAATAGMSGLQYDPLTGQYVYSWKTAKSWAGTCRALTLELTDVTTHTVYFRFSR